MKPAAVLAVLIGFFGSAQIIHADLLFTSVPITGSPFGINDSADIVGMSLDGQRTKGFLYSGGLVYTLSVPGSSNTFAYGINNSGQIVGTANGQTGTFGFLEMFGVYSPITVPGASGTTVRGINDADQIVGYFGDSTGRQIGFLNTSDDIFTQISVPGAFSTFPYDINTAGEVVGYFTDSAGNADGFIYSNGIHTTVVVPGSSDTFVYGVNDAGQIVGSFIDSSGTHGFLESNGIFTTFDAPDTLPTSGTFARDINNAGQILVWGDGSGTFLATETVVPEPSLACLTCAVLVGMRILRKQLNNRLRMPSIVSTRSDRRHATLTCDTKNPSCT